jgi:hypothetical protein
MATTALARRVAALEANGDGGGGCDRCCGTLIIWETLDAEFVAARWNGEDITEEQLREHENETQCPQCGRTIDPDEGIDILLGGRRS